MPIFSDNVIIPDFVKKKLMLLFWEEKDLSKIKRPFSLNSVGFLASSTCSCTTDAPRFCWFLAIPCKELLLGPFPSLLASSPIYDCNYYVHLSPLISVALLWLHLHEIRLSLKGHWLTDCNHTAHVHGNISHWTVRLFSNHTWVRSESNESTDQETYKSDNLATYIQSLCESLFPCRFLDH